MYGLRDTKAPFFSPFHSVGSAEWCLAETEKAFLSFSLSLTFSPPIDVCRYVKLAKLCSVPLGLLGEEPDKRDSAGGDAIRVTDLDSFSHCAAAAATAAVLRAIWKHIQLIPASPITPPASP